MRDRRTSIARLPEESYEYGLMHVMAVKTAVLFIFHLNKQHKALNECFLCIVSVHRLGQRWRFGRSFCVVFCLFFTRAKNYYISFFISQKRGGKNKSPGAFAMTSSSCWHQCAVVVIYRCKEISEFMAWNRIGGFCDRLTLSVPINVYIDGVFVICYRRILDYNRFLFCFLIPIESKGK